MKKTISILIIICTLTLCLISCGECEHQWSEATCAERSVCTECGEIGELSYWHSYGEWITTKEATCTSEGSKERYCSCGEKETTIIEITHNYGDWTIYKEATCSEKGTKYRDCTSCETRDIEDIEKTEHTFGKWSCTQCHYTKEETLNSINVSVPKLLDEFSYSYRSPYAPNISSETKVAFSSFRIVHKSINDDGIFTFSVYFDGSIIFNEKSFMIDIIPFVITNSKGVIIDTFFIVNEPPSSDSISTQLGHSFSFELQENESYKISIANGMKYDEERNLIIW